MSVLDFPASPSVGQIATLTNNFSYKWDGAVWGLTPSAGGYWTDTGTALTPADPAKLLSLPTTDPGHALQWGNQTSKARLIHHPTVNAAYFTENHLLSAGAASWLCDDATKPSWGVLLRADADNFRVARAAVGAPNTIMNLLMLDGAGVFKLNPGGVVATTISPGLSTWLWTNSLWGTQEDAAKPSWGINLNCTADSFTISRRPPGGSSGGGTSFVHDAVGNLLITGSVATKTSGTTWANPSDPRLKRDVVPYTAGLDAICALQPIAFKFNGRGGTTDDDRQCWGYDASEVQSVFPECVGTRTAKLDPDDQDDTDLLTLDTSNILLALVNAVKELTARVAVLEAA